MRLGVRRAAAIVGAALVALAVTPPAPADHWPFFGGDAGRSGHQLRDGGVPPVEPLWSATGPATQDVLTSVITTGGPPGQARVVYGTGDRRTTDGDIIGGRVHVRTAAGGVPVTPPEGIKLSDEPDAFGDGFGSVSFADTSTASALGQVWIVYNDVNGVSIAQVDETTGELVQDRKPNPAEINDKLVAVTVNSSVLLSPPDADGTRALFFVGFADVAPIETLYKVTITRADTRDAQITLITTVNGDFNLVDFASPTLVWLTANASNNEAHVVVGDCNGRLYTFAVDDLAPGPVAAVGAESDCVMTVSAPVTATGLPPGAPGSGLTRTPVFYVATGDAEGTSTRVHRLIQTTSIQFRREPNAPMVLPGGPANAIALDAVVSPSGTLGPGGRVFVTTGRNLYALDAGDLTRVVARLDPDDALVPGDTGFSQTTPAVTGDLLFVTRDNGEQLVVDKHTLQPVPAGMFRAVDASRPGDRSLAFGQPSLSHRSVTFAGSRGVFSYRLRSATPPTGYWMAAADGGVFSFGEAGFFGSMGGTPLNSPVTAMAPTPSGNGYWLVARDGGVFTFGDAAFAGSAAGITLNAPIVAMAATPTGRGYWLAAADGAVFTYGDAGFHGSAGGMRLHEPVVGIAPTATGLGYWLVAGDGAVFSFGDAAFFGSMGGTPLRRPVIGMAPTPGGTGYWLAASDGGVFTFGAAAFHGSTGGTSLNSPIVAIAGGASGAGYTLIARDGGVFTFGDAAFHGSTGATPLNQPVVGGATRG